MAASDIVKGALSSITESLDGRLRRCLGARESPPLRGLREADDSIELLFFVNAFLLEGVPKTFLGFKLSKMVLR